MTKKTLLWISSVFVGLCLWQIATTLLSTDQRQAVTLLQQTVTQEASVTADSNSPVVTPPPVLQVNTSLQFGATGGSQETVLLGDASSEESLYEYELELDTRGAAIRTARFSRHNDRNPKDPQPLAILTPAGNGPSQEVLSLANSYFMLPNHNAQLNLGQLHWQAGSSSQDELGQQSVTFNATITANNEPALRLSKIYTLRPNDFVMDCVLQVENLMDTAETAAFNLYGPCGMDKEDMRMDNRMVVAAYRDDNNQITSSRIDIKTLNKAIKKGDTETSILKPKQSGNSLLWVGTVNKYFGGLIIPVDESLNPDSHWVGQQRAMRFDADGNTGTKDDTNIGFYLQSKSFNLAASGSPDSTQTFRTQIYLGPKDKQMFDKNERYSALGFKETISFISCCCPASIINPLAFLILKIMNMLYVVTHNYGIAIIILVAVMRALLHPVTKKSQISMQKMSKLAPRAEEIKKKYANNKAEMQKQLMELYREQGASPITGMLPMFIQMPIWIALWSAVNSSIALRGEGLLPFWITDLSSPDRLFPFFGLNLPILGEYFNLLPILMGVAFYLQQKLMPTQASAATNPQVAQQQKMMMVMMPILFPIMFYNVASGVNLYIMTSTFAGVIEQKIIRKHIKEREEQEGKNLVNVTSKTGGKVKKKKPKPMFKDH